VKSRARLSAVVSHATPLLPPSIVALMALESNIRATKTLSELQILVANTLLEVTPASQALVLKRTAVSRFKTVSASGVARVDPHAPMVAHYEQTVQARLAAHGYENPGTIGPFLIQDVAEDQTPSHAFHGVVVPLVRQGHMLGVLLCLSTMPWRDESLTLLARVAETTAHAWAAHQPLQRWKNITKGSTMLMGCGLIATTLLALVPVPMTALAPARVVTREPFVITAPVDGVVDDILVKPNQYVLAGAALVRFVELQLAAKAENATRELAVADARFKRVSLVALTNIEAKRELAIVEAELALKRSERDFAGDQLTRSRVVAPHAGVALFGDKRDWIGRPVTTGERILELGDPSRVEVQLELPVEDAIAMTIGQRVSVFLDSAPLSPVAAEVIRINHEPRVIEGKGLASAWSVSIPAADFLAPAMGRPLKCNHPFFKRPLFNV
jgi:multidrug resistance efflux pump